MSDCATALQKRKPKQKKKNVCSFQQTNQEFLPVFFVIILCREQLFSIIFRAITHKLSLSVSNISIQYLVIVIIMQ